MDRRHRYLAILAQSDASVQQAAGQAFRRLLELIRQGNAPRTAIDQILREFNADTVSGFREAFSAVLESSLGEKTLKAWPVSSKHPKTDICDYHAKVDLYGLGPGVYPKAEAPKPPFHPHCFCVAAPRIDLINPKPRFNPNAERTFLATLPAKEAAQVAGSFEKRRRILEDKESLEGIYNAGKDELYQWKKIGDIEAMPAFIRSSTVQQAEREALRLGVKSADYQQRLDIANIVNDALNVLVQRGLSPPDHLKIDDRIFVKWAHVMGVSLDDLPAAFTFNRKTGKTWIYLNPQAPYWMNPAAEAQQQHQIGQWSSDHPDHAIWHELGHLIFFRQSSTLHWLNPPLAQSEIPIAAKIGRQAKESVREFMAETFAALLAGRSLPADILSLYQQYGGIIP